MKNVKQRIEKQNAVLNLENFKQIYVKMVYNTLWCIAERILY